MPSFDDAVTIASPPEEVFKLLHDPSRIPDWMDGVGSVDAVKPAVDATAFTLYPAGYPDFPMAQRLSVAGRRRVTLSCLVSFLEFSFLLEERPGDQTRLSVHVEIPPEEATRLATQQAAVRASLKRLATIAPAE